ncbi:sulfate adenylyltransferase subunit 1 [Catenulispora sp. EB89]|uniref:sulfate adenylyltransferase subunit 1 n=1 Tax=Catenulispora sp. EB89 TaxID=3156257 RepID=UPI0035179661
MGTTGNPTAPAEAASLLRLVTAGSVDDGKSTLVGRLLHDSRSLPADQLAAVVEASQVRGLDTPDLALFTDGLRAEREQGITIDVAYRHFATARRRFILADTPGHVQYTRNMVTGASTAELALILVDARAGLGEQTRRHTAVAALLGVPHVVLVVNKMDLVGHAEPVFAAITEEFARYAAALDVRRVDAVPVSALHGDNVVTPSAGMPWYRGPTLLERLETAPIGADPAARPARLPVQYVIRARTSGHREYRGYAGQLTSGRLRPGDSVTVLPAGITTTVAALDVLGEPSDEVRAPQSVAVRLADDIDVSRGDMIAADPLPQMTRDVAATVVHLAERPLRTGDRVLLKHATRTLRAVVTDIPYSIAVDTLARVEPTDGGARLRMNDIGRVLLRTAEPVTMDDYRDHRDTGSFLLIDPAGGDTLTAGLHTAGPE